MSEEEVKEVLKGIIDPEVGMDIMQMGLVKEIKVEENGVRIKMTFTSPFCPLQHYMIEQVKKRIKDAGASWVDVEVVWD